MSRFFATCLTYSAVSIFGIPGPAHSGQSADARLVAGAPRIHVRVYNYPNVPQWVLRSAEQEASRIYRQGGIDLAWVDCPRSAKEVDAYPACEKLFPGPSVLQVKLLSHTMADRLRAPRLDFGLSMMGEGEEFARNSSILYHRVEALAGKGITSRPVLLGHALAHEIGHLLLGRGSHARKGIMRVPWDKRQLRLAAQGQLLFTSREATRVRAQAWKRVQASRADWGAGSMQGGAERLARTRRAGSKGLSNTTGQQASEIPSERAAAKVGRAERVAPEGSVTLPD